eukprot:TRINITY_DN6291_c0_g1_i11.p1 TRINITY_DN6291_c0_g1~~TRINITY_DN6291_c0_g1_i11.p1  ORF type:complete len:147 (-),score=19.30 TRINITY_DN6291_c0_g1_i11:12-452(-)
MKSELVIWSLSSPRAGEKWAFVTLFTTKRCTSYSTLCFSDSSKGFKMLQIIRTKPQSKEQSEIHKENLTRTLDQSTDPNFNTNDEPQNPRTPSTGDPLQMRRSLQGRRSGKEWAAKQVFFLFLFLFTLFSSIFPRFIFSVRAERTA